MNAPSLARSHNVGAVAALFAVLFLVGAAVANQDAQPADGAAPPSGVSVQPGGDSAAPTDPTTPPAGGADPANATPDADPDSGSGISKTISETKKQIDENETAQEAAAGILRPIYQLAESLSFPAFHWIAFALMVTGVVSFALQLVIGKLVMLSRMHFSLMEILNDAVGLAINLLGLVLTTQAATQNSTFPASPAAVLSATAVGALLGLIFYFWGQSQEIRAARDAARK